MRICLALCWIVALCSTLWADGAVVPMRHPSQVDVSVYEPGQKALIGWNGSSEVLILSTDVSAQTQTKALQIVPLPSKPKIGTASFDVFVAVQKAMGRHSPPVGEHLDVDGRDETEKPAGVEIVFRKKIGPHHITVAKAGGYEEFMAWTEAFVGKLGPERPRFSRRFERVIADLITNGICYFVFDIIDIGEDVGSVQPISYLFSTDRLYYPLKISSVVEGNTYIQLFLVSRFPLAFEGNERPLRPVVYYTSDGQKAVHFSLTRSEVGEISDQIAALLGGRGAYFSALKYRGRLGSLWRDLWLEPEKKPFDPRSDELFLRKGE